MPHAATVHVRSAISVRSEFVRILLTDHVTDDLTESR
jgi:hypothetical protein